MANFKKDQHQFEAQLWKIDGKKAHIPDEESMNEILNNLSGAEYKIDKVERKERSRNPSPPYITSTLQQDAYRRLGFSARKTMRVAQQLYEGVNISGEGQVGLITYLRTDSTRVSNTALEDAKAYIKNVYGKDYHPGKPRVFKGKKQAQDAHEAIRPTRVDLTPSKVEKDLNADQVKLYRLIWKRFIASQMSSAKFDVIIATIQANNMTFRTKGSKLKFPGFYQLQKEELDEDVILPELHEGEVLELVDLTPNQHFTQPPPRYSEATLVKTLEKEGVGRPSTYATIIDTIQDKGYVVQEEKKLFPTELGQIVVEQLQEFFPNVVDVEFTAEVEAGLDKIEEGKKDWQEFLSEFYEPFKKQVEVAEEKMKEVELEEQVSDVKCEKCDDYMVIKHGRYGKFLACPNFPECKNTKSLVKELNIKCPKCQGAVVERKSKKGKKFYGCSNYPDCDFVCWHRPIENKHCPTCGTFMVQRGRKNKYYQCANAECDYTEQAEADVKSKSKRA